LLDHFRFNQSTPSLERVESMNRSPIVVDT
jgi:hypothetical protein